MSTEDSTTTVDADFDVAAWLAGATYAHKSVEIFRDNDKLLAIAELQETITEVKKAKRESGRNLESIADITDAVAEAEDAIASILASLKGTGIVFDVQGIEPGELKLIGDTVARKMKPVKAAVYDEESGAIITEAHKGGREHPDYAKRFEEKLIARCIQGITTGGRALPVLDAEGVKNLRDKIHPMEFRRLSNTVSDLNYSAYDIDKEVTVDFS